MRSVVLIVHNIRSCHNVGSLLRTAEGMGVEEVYLTGYTPYPLRTADDRLPHLAQKIDVQIHKTALGAEQSIVWHYNSELGPVVHHLRTNKFRIVALEQAEGATQLPKLRPPQKIALIVGREVEGIEPEVLALCDQIAEIPMFGRKESFNVAVAAAIALYHITFASPA